MISPQNNSQPLSHQKNCIVLYCIMRPYTEGQLDRYHIGIPRENPNSALNLG